MKKVLTVDRPNEALKFLYRELERRTDYYWTTSSGKEMKLQDMTLKHLKNTINYIEKREEEARIVLENCVDALDYYD